MGKNSRIRWTGHSWNPVTGCTQVSPGCDNCYALVLAERFRGARAYPQGFDITLRPNKLHQPMTWKTPARIFVNSMSDLFHRGIPDDYLVEIWDIMLRADHHVYQILTKRPHRMQHKIRDLGLALPPHIWLGTSVESQRFAENRIPPLLEAGSAFPWISAEPLLERLDLTPWLDNLAWLVVGGESGAGRREFDHDWARDLLAQCRRFGVPFFFKQGASLKPDQDKLLDGVQYDEYPEYDWSLRGQQQLSLLTV